MRKEDNLKSGRKEEEKMEGSVGRISMEIVV